MVNPVPGRSITTPFGRRGRWWSCNRDAAGNGWHTGADWAAPQGTPIVAARGGTVRHTTFGSAFGPFQFAIDPGDGTRDFYAHTLDRPPAGARVATGARVARVGSLGNSTGPHLHFELHRNLNGWSCAVHVNPQPSIDFTEAPPVTHVTSLSPQAARQVAAAVWDHNIEGAQASWLLRHGFRIVRAYLGPSKDNPGTETRQAIIARNIRALLDRPGAAGFSVVPYPYPYDDDELPPPDSDYSEGLPREERA